jgi:hypothetical protein
VRDNDTGETFRFQWSGAQPPTEQDIKAKVEEERAKKVPPTPAPSHEPDRLEQLANDVEDFAIGGVLRSGVARSAYNAARLMTKPAPGASPLPEDPAFLQPKNDAERAGQALEQMAEFFVPSAAISKVPRLATAPTLAKAAMEAAGSAGVATVQGGNPATAAATAALGPVLGKVLTSVPKALRVGAEEQVTKALGATKERYKAMANRLAPQILKRGLGGSRESLLAQATETASLVGDEIDDALMRVGARGVDPKPVIDALESAKDAFRTTALDGTVVVFEPRSIKQLEKLQKIVGDLGPNASVDQLVAVRRAWDKVVDQAGGFSHRAPGAIGVPLKDTTEAWAKREASGAIRKLLEVEAPDLAAVNKEYAFWKQLEDVLTQTQQRTQPQGKGIGSIATKGAGQVVGGIAGSSGGPMGAVGGAVVVGQLAEMARRAFTSPRWRLIDARLRNQLADALSSGNTQQATNVLTRITAFLGSKVGGSMPAPQASH